MKKRIGNIVVLALLVAGTCGWAVAQSKEEPADRAVVPLSNPAKPAKIEVTVMRGSITVKGYQGKDIIVEARVREKALAGFGGLFSTGTAVAPPALAAPAAQPTPAPAPATPPHRPDPEGGRGASSRPRWPTRKLWPSGSGASTKRAPAPTASSSRTTRKPVKRKRRRSPA